MFSVFSMQVQIKEFVSVVISGEKRRNFVSHSMYVCIYSMKILFV